MSPQAGPTSGQDFTGFPEATLPRRRHVYRSHRPDDGPCYFNGTATFRFNLLSGRGTCYVADDVETAVREKLRDEILEQSVVPASLAESFIVSTILTSRSFRCANVSHRDSARHRVTRMLVTMEDYDVPQQWAAAFDEAGYDGIRYASRFTSGSENSGALFGEAGENEFGTVTAELSGPAACRRAGVTVYDTPRSDELDFV